MAAGSMMNAAKATPQAKLIVAPGRELSKYLRSFGIMPGSRKAITWYTSTGMARITPAISATRK